MATTFPGRPTALVCGTRIAPYHPLAAVEPLLRAILAGDFAVRGTEETGELGRGLAGVKLIIGYADLWEEPLPDTIAAGLVDFVERGGGLLVLHNGICWARHVAVRPLLGGAFTGHPEQEVMRYGFVPRHPLGDGLEGFRLREEPYRYELEPSVEMDVFLHYEQAGRRWPAGWALERGAGRVVNLQPGHAATAFENTGYAALVRRSARWCAQMG